TCPRPDDRDDAAWSRAAAAAAELESFLDRPEDFRLAPADVAGATHDLQQLTRAVRDPLDALRQRLLRERADVGAPGRAEPAGLIEADALLQTSVLAAGQRAALWKAAREFAARLQEKTLAQDQEDSQPGKPAQPAPPPDSRPAPAAEGRLRR